MRSFLPLAVLVGWLILAPHAFGQGIYLPASGAVNRGMAGATTGAAIESIGSLYNNPATIGHLSGNEMAFGFEAIAPSLRIESTLPLAGSGATNAENGANPVPSIGWTHRIRPDTTIGLGLFGAAGYSVNMRADATNPILGPPLGLGGTGVGGIHTDALFYQMAPVIAVNVTDRLSIGGGPVINMGKIMLDENGFAPLNANGVYPRGDGTRFHWGLGAQLGFHYIRDNCWQFGGNVKTPMWFEPFRYFGETATGLPRVDQVNVELPMVVSIGTAYTGFEYATLTADVRYLDYTSTEGFGGAPSYEPSGRATGLGWNDVFSFHLGAQVKLTSCLIVRAGYIYATDLIDDQFTFFNLGSDLSYRHVPTVGATLRLSDNATVSFAYNYLVQWGSTGPYNVPGVGVIPGSSVRTSLDTHIATFGVNVNY